jgi:threonine dehydrogenase-like Zn-dependent dehydrogenase
VSPALPPPVPRVGGRVVELVAARDIVIAERPVPEPGLGEARVRVLAVGICGTDVHGYLGRADTLPITLGHDAVGVVDLLPAGSSSGLSVGDRVAIDPTISCGVCAWCTVGKSQLCEAGSYLGMTCPGTMADYITLPVTRLIPVAAALTDVEATVLEPIGVALHLLDRIGSFAPAAMRAEVIGGGPLGVLLAQTLEAHGWTTIVHEPQPYRRAIAEMLGLATSDGSAATAATTGAILVVEASASGPGIELARRLANPGSVVGIIGRAPADIPTSEILQKELSVIGVKSGFGQYAIDLVASGAVNARATVTHSFDLIEAAHAFESVTDSSQSVMRAVLHTVQHLNAKESS